MTFTAAIRMWAVCIIVAGAAVVAGAVEQNLVFESGVGGYHTYRIPSLIVAGNGDLIALCEGRRASRSDTGDIDLICRRSTDGGRTWGEPSVVWDEAGNTCGNPCPVVDASTGVIWLLMTHNLGIDDEKEIKQRRGEGTRTVWLCRSDDHGAHWSTPHEITAEVKASDWTWYATGPGAGIQLTSPDHEGRLVIPCDHNTRDGRYGSHVIYSDDHGQSWRVGGIAPDYKVNECEVVELSDGRLLLNMRNYDSAVHARQIAFSDDGGATWHSQRHDEVLIEPRCQASLRRALAPTVNSAGLILFSNPASENRRERLTVRGSTDDGASWPLALELHRGSGAYSCLAALPDGAIGCLYEADDYRRIVMARFAPTELKPLAATVESR